MKKQQGIADLWLVVIGAIAILGLVSGIVFGVTHYLSGVRAEAMAAGKSKCDAAYKSRDNAALTAALGKVRALEEAAREAERRHGLAITAITSQLKKEQANGQAAEKRILADIAAGRLRVRGDAFQAGACPAVSDRGQVGSPSASTGGSDAATACRLSDATAGALLAIGRDADDTALQLAAAQAVIIQDRVTCGQ